MQVLRIWNFFVSAISGEARTFLNPPLTYAPDGWNARLDGPGSQGWNFEGVVDAERKKWDAFRRNLSGTGPLGFSHEYEDPTVVRNVSFHNIHTTFAYVVALASRMKSSISVLDYGGGLGHYYLLARAVLPEVSFEFHCKEVPGIAEAGKSLLPEVRWHSDDACLERTYDLVMVNGSLQYMENWKEMIGRIARSAENYFLLTRVPVVDRAASFVTVQREYDTRMLHGIFNRRELLDAVAATGLREVRELVVGDRPYTKKAPEQPELRGWLFRRAAEIPTMKANR